MTNNAMKNLTINQINAIAQPEGWAIFSCEGSEGGDYQIQRLDMEAIFKDDSQAIKHVARLSLHGSSLDKSANCSSNRTEPKGSICNRKINITIMEKLVIRFEPYYKAYHYIVILSLTEDLEVSGHYNEVSDEFEPSWFNSDEAEELYDQHWEWIDEQIQKAFAEISKLTQPQEFTITK